jgi:uncharacterized zinc-type alcohol dehydrogenase-like protein
VVNSRQHEEMMKHAGSFDFILDTVSADHDINAEDRQLLRRDGNLTLVGAPDKTAWRVELPGRSSAGAASRDPLIGGIAGAQEMLGFLRQAWDHI